MTVHFTTTSCRFPIVDQSRSKELLAAEAIRLIDERQQRWDRVRVCVPVFHRATHYLQATYTYIPIEEIPIS